MSTYVAGESVAVVLPVHNGARHLAEALRSVVEQTRPPDQILVIDDGSTDGSSEIARSFDGVTVLEQAQSGVSVARNRGIWSSLGCVSGRRRVVDLSWDSVRKLYNMAISAIQR